MIDSRRRVQNIEPYCDEGRIVVTLPFDTLMKRKYIQDVVHVFDEFDKYATARARTVGS